MGSFNQAQKEQISKKLRFNLNERIKKLKYEQESLVKNLDSKVKHRLNLVPKKYWSVKLKDVIELERYQKVTFASLINQLTTEQSKSTINGASGAAVDSTAAVGRIGSSVSGTARSSVTRGTNGVAGGIRGASVANAATENGLRRVNSVSRDKLKKGTQKTTGKEGATRTADGTNRANRIMNRLHSRN